MRNKPPKCPLSQDFKHYNDFCQLVHPDDIDRLMKSMKDHLEGKSKLYEAEYRIKTKSGGYFWFNDRGKIVENDGQGNMVVLGIVMDIQNLKEKLILTQEQKERLEKLTDAMVGREEKIQELEKKLSDKI